MTKKYVTIRLETDEVRSIDQLVKAGATKSRSDFIRSGTRAFLSQFTGEININDIAKRLKELETRFNILKNKLEGTIDGL